MSTPLANAPNWVLGPAQTARVALPPAKGESITGLPILLAGSLVLGDRPGYRLLPVPPLSRRVPLGEGLCRGSSTVFSASSSSRSSPWAVQALQSSGIRVDPSVIQVACGKADWNVFTNLAGCANGRWSPRSSTVEPDSARTARSVAQPGTGGSGDQLLEKQPAAAPQSLDCGLSGSRTDPSLAAEHSPEVSPPNCAVYRYPRREGIR